MKGLDSQAISLPRDGLITIHAIVKYKEFLYLGISRQLFIYK